MGKYKSTYLNQWKETFKWLRQCSDKYSAKCAVCNITFKIDNAGMCQVKSHEKSTKHINTLNILAGRSSQSTFSSGSARVELSKGVCCLN